MSNTPYIPINGQIDPMAQPDHEILVLGVDQRGRVLAFGNTTAQQIAEAAAEFFGLRGFPHLMRIVQDDSGEWLDGIEPTTLARNLGTGPFEVVVAAGGI